MGLSCLVPPGSSTDVSEDWEKDFDLDMTEEEVQVALSKIEASGEVGGVFSGKGSNHVWKSVMSFSPQLEEDWENWD